MESNLPFDNAVAALESQIQDAQLFVERQLSYLHSGGDVASMEMLGAEFGLAPGLEDAQALVSKTNQFIVNKLKDVGEAIAIFLDRSGRRKIQQLQRRVSELPADAKPSSGQIKNRALANQFAIKNIVSNDYRGELDRLTTHMTALTDRYIPAVYERDRKLWEVASRSGYLKSGHPEDLLSMIEDLMEVTGKNVGGYLNLLPEEGVGIYYGGRHLMYRDQPHHIRKYRGVSDRDSQAVYKALSEMDVHAARPRGQTRKVNAQVHSGVMDLPSIDQLGEILDVLGKMADVIERLAAILKKSEAKQLQSRIRTMLSKAEDLDRYEVSDDWDNPVTLDAANVDEGDRWRLMLLRRYITHSQFDTAVLLMGAVNLCTSIWQSHVDLVEASLKSYKS